MTAPALAESKFLKYALRYAELGFFVFPLRPRDKIPLISSKDGGQGFKDATRNEKTVRGWWGQWPNANIGLWLGPSNLVAVDLDGPECVALAQEFGLLREPTLTCKTGRADGGEHRYYRKPLDLVVGNVMLGAGLRPVKESEGLPYLLLRSQDGYVVAPPSIHPDTGAEYQWIGTPGKADELADLPAELLAKLRALASDGVDAAPGTASDGATIKEGNRNNYLVKVAGALVSQHKAPEAADLLYGHNLAHCDPPYTRSQCEAIIINLTKREVKKVSRLTDTGRVLTSGSPLPPVEVEMPLPLDLSIQHTEGAIAETRADHSDAPRWEWPDLHDLVGPMLPGYFVVVGGLPGGGKTSLLLSELEYCSQREIPAVYMPLEVDPPTMLRKRAAWARGFDWEYVVRNDWAHLPAGAQEQIEAKIREYGKQGHIQMPPDKKLTLAALERWVRWGIKEIGARIVFVDHIHRTDVGGSAEGHRINFTDAIRAVKDLGREHGVAIVAAAHLNRNSELFDKYSPPHLGRLKETSALAEEAEYVLMLSRKLRQATISREDVEAIRMGQREIRDFAEENVMVATCRKHRVIDSANDRSVKLLVQDGHVRSLYQGPVRP